MNKTAHQINERYACIPKPVVQAFVKLCAICNMKVVQASQPRLMPIR